MKLLPINSCLECKHCVQTKSTATDFYEGNCSYGWSINDLTSGRITKSIWVTGVNQCVVGRIPDWCPLDDILQPTDIPLPVYVPLQKG